MKSILRQGMVVVAFSALLMAGPVFAAGIENPLKAEKIQDLLTDLLTILIDIAVLVAIIFIIISGLKMVLAQGSPEKLKEARTMLMYTLIGAAIAIGAKTIQLTIQNTVNSLK